MIAHVTRRCLVVLAVSVIGACAPKSPAVPVVTTPRFPDYPALTVPPALMISAPLLALHDTAGLRLQSGDLRGAMRDYQRVIASEPQFYPAETGLGFAQLADRQFKQAAARFSSALSKNDGYLPAWIGLADAQLGLDDEEQAIVSMERVLALDPKRESVRSRLELVRFRQLQTLIDQGRRARSAGRYAEARERLTGALALSPTSAAILSELVATETAARDFGEAERYARRAVEVEPGDAEMHAQLGATLEAAGNVRDAALAFTRAAVLDGRPEWRALAAELRERANLAALPPEFPAIESAPTVTRAHVAAFVGLKLESLIESAPKRAAQVATDIRAHWASPWILPVTQAGVMDVYPNHTFQPNTLVRRNDLAQLVSRLLAIVAVGRPQEAARWRDARPRFTDLPATNVFYRAAALAVASGAMAADEGGRFAPTRSATGAELSAVIARMQQLAEQ